MGKRVSEKVIVLFTPQIKAHRERKLFVARCRELGLTAYGTTPDEAVYSLKHLFQTFISRQRKLGRLEELLTKAKVKWFRESEYKGKPYEDMTRGGAKVSPLASWSDMRPEQLLMAA